MALLVGGGALAFVPGLPVIELDPEFVLVLFLPPPLMDAYFTAHAEFRKHPSSSARAMASVFNGSSAIDAA